ncbi:MAG: hypothetical protein ABIJ23_03475 [Candidatus Magasanikbacteria bacterium]
MDDYFKVKIEEELKKLGEADKNQAGLLSRWNGLQMTDLEKYLLTCIFSPSVDDWGNTIKKYEEELPRLRGLSEGVEYWFSSKQVYEMEFTDEFLTSPTTKANLLASIKLWHLDDYSEPAKELLRKFDKYTNGTFTFDNLEDDWSSFYIRVTLLLVINYFEELPLVWQGYFLNSDFFHLIIVLNLDLNSALQRAIESNVYIFDRKDYALQYATFVYDNKTPVAIKPSGEGLTDNSFWIDLFRQFSKQKFDGISLIEFFNDKEIWRNCDIEDKMVIKEVLILYSHLISDIYVYPTDDEIKKFKKEETKENIKEVDQKSNDGSEIKYKKIKKDIEARFPKDENDEYDDIPGILEELERLAIEQGDDKISELFFWDENLNKFSWTI